MLLLASYLNGRTFAQKCFLTLKLIIPKAIHIPKLVQIVQHYPWNFTHKKLKLVTKLTVFKKFSKTEFKFEFNVVEKIFRH